jgi:RNA-directed DNA polymerase
MLSALERGIKGNKWFSLIDKVWSMKTLALAWEKVRANAGSCGVDGITVERFAKDSEERLLAVKEQLMEACYQPKPVKRVWIPKAGSAEKRPLGIPTVLDRVVQTAIKMVIEPIFEREFAEQSYGFRPGRGCKDALRRVESLLHEGHTHVVDVDIKGYFDSIPQAKLMERVKERIADGRVLGLIEGFLTQGIMEGTNWQESKEGTPQGGIISPLLANIYLDPLDHLMADKGVQMVRYADDFVVLCTSATQAQEILEELRQWSGGVGLELHREKTRIVEMAAAGNHFDFLGYRFYRSKKRGRLTRLVRPKSKRKLRDALKAKTKRTNGHCMAAIINNVNKTLAGWYAYFKQANKGDMRTMDTWLRGRLRAILRKRAGRRGRSRNHNDHIRWPNRYFDELGLFNLTEAKVFDTLCLEQRAKH